MPGRVHVVDAFARLRKARHSAELAQRVEIAQTARHDLVRIRLMPNIEKQLIVGAIEHAMACEDKFHHAQARGHMAPCVRGGSYDLLSNFSGKYGKLLVSEERAVRWGRHQLKHAMAVQRENPRSCPNAGQ